MDNTGTVKCHKCGREINKKSRYKRNDFRFNWYYCKECKAYNACDGDRAFLTVGYSEEMNNAVFPYSFRTSFMKMRIKELDESLQESIRYFDDLSEIKANKGNVIVHKGRYEEISYRMSFDEKSNGLILIGRYGSPIESYNMLEEELKKLVYNFDEIDAQRRDKRVGMVMSWKRLAKEVNMTELELKMILKNKTVRKLNAEEIRILSHYCGCKINGYGWKEIERNPWYR